jgi:hypothetical protein
MVPQKEKERRKKISKTLKEYYSTPEGRQSKVQASTGRKHSQETKEKLSLLRKEKNWMRGKHHSEETRRKISEAMKNRKITWGDKISKAKKGNVVVSEEQRKQISETLKERYLKNPGTFKGKKHTEESKEKMRKANLNRYDGPNHPQWRGGITHDPYCFCWPDISKAIRGRDKYTCQNFDCNNLEDLVTHHIDYDKGNCDGKNLITLCRSCNAKANFDRDHHKNFYKNVLVEKGILKRRRGN